MRYLDSKLPHSKYPFIESVEVRGVNARGRVTSLWLRLSADVWEKQSGKINPKHL